MLFIFFDASLAKGLFASVNFVTPGFRDGRALLGVGHELVESGEVTDGVPKRPSYPLASTRFRGVACAPPQ